MVLQAVSDHAPRVSQVGKLTALRSLLFISLHVNQGGAMYIGSSTVTIDSCSFTMNSAVSKACRCLFSDMYDMLTLMYR